ncbi:hypothetical protein [uncultured Bacteroides sp.]|uniref:hypothetical protein n=1 Tax=uncultured Bacteroides sp. TaxID=162156 RepID=UPI002AA73C15|nr:hypothetical protein [uncultured Bacteroides sp.]
MSFLGGIVKGIGKAAKGVVKTVGKVANGVAKVAGASGIPIISSIGSIVDMAIPDAKVVEMQAAVVDSGSVNVQKVEETVAKFEPNVVKAQATTQALTKALATTTGATIDDSTAVTNIDTVTKITQWVKKPIVWGSALAALVIGLIVYFNKGKKRRRY